MKINRFDPDHPLWSDLVDQPQRADMRRWVLDEADRPTGNLLFFLGAVEDAGGEAVREAFVVTFAVDEAHRRRGIDRALAGAPRLPTPGRQLR